MLKHLLPICILSSIIFAGCNAAVDPDNASAITGTYKMTVYNAQSNPAPGNNLVITKIDKNTVKVVVDYLDPTSTDVVLDKMVITKNGSIYNLAKTYSNASATGNVNGSTFTLDVDYTTGTDMHVVAVK